MHHKQIVALGWGLCLLFSALPAGAQAPAPGADAASAAAPVVAPAALPVPPVLVAAPADGHVDLSVWAERLEEIMLTPDAKHRVPLVQLVADAVRVRALAEPAAVMPPPDQQSSRSVDTREEVYPESGFIESRFGDRENTRERKPRDPDEPHYVKNLR